MRLIKKLALDWVKCIVEIIMISLILCVFTVIGIQKPNCYIWVALLPLFSLVGLLVPLLLHRVVILDVFFDVVLAAGLAYLLGQKLGATTPEWGCMGALGIALAIRARALASRYWTDVSPIHLYTILLAFNLIFALLTGIIPVMEPFRPAATWLGPVIVLTGLLTMNQLHLTSLTDVQRNPLTAGGMAVPRTMNRENKRLLLGIFLVILALSCLRGLMTALKWLGRMAFRLAVWLASLFSAESGTDNGGGSDEMNLAEVFGTGGNNRNPIWERIEEIIIHAVVYIALAAAAVFLLWMAYKGLRKLFAFLRSLHFNGDEEESAADEYTDTKERLVELKDLPKTYLNRARDWIAEQLKREPNWNDLKTVSEKVRALYRRTVYKASARGFRYKDSLTPSQALPQAGQYIKTDPADLDTLRRYYEAVRYANREPEAAPVEDLNKRI